MALLHELEGEVEHRRLVTDVAERPRRDLGEAELDRRVREEEELQTRVARVVELLLEDAEHWLGDVRARRSEREMVTVRSRTQNGRRLLEGQLRVGEHPG